MRRTEVVCNAYREKKLNECFKLLLTKKPVEHDYVAIDTTGLVGNALRVSKGTEQKRMKDVARFVSQGIHQVLRKVACKKSLLLVMDGAESLTKAHITRNTTVTRRMEGRLSRLPGTALMQSVEDKLLRMMPASAPFPPEVVVSGTRAPGCVEEKISAWALDIAGSPGFRGASESMCLVGSNEVYLNMLGLTPFYNISSAVQSNADVKALHISQVLDWLEVRKFAEEGRNRVSASIRTDALFLLLLYGGCSATGLPGLTGCSLHNLLDRYHKVVVGPLSTAGAEADDAGAAFLFRDLPGNKLELNAALLATLLGHDTSSSPTTFSDSNKGSWKTWTGEYLDLLLQSHCLLCQGYTPNPYLIPQFPVNKVSEMLDVGLLRSYLPLHNKLTASSCSSSSSSSFASAASLSGVSNELGEQWPSPLPLFYPTQPLTAAEFTVLSHSHAVNVEPLMQMFTGATLLPDVAKKICTLDTVSASNTLREAFALSAAADHPHKCLFTSPSYVWSRRERSQTWRMRYIDLGARSRENEVRRRCNERLSADASLSVTDASQDNPLLFDPKSQQWQTIKHFSEVEPLGTTATVPDTTTASAAAPRSFFKALTWNVMFDRYSGQPTPLGMPGIDWCSPKRYPVLAKLIAQEDADVVGLQEVEPVFLDYLASQQWCRDRYVLSCFSSSAAVSPWGVLLMIRRRQGLVLEDFRHINIPAWSGHTSLMPVATLRVGRASESRTVSVAAAHLLAPFTKTSENARTAQDGVLRLRATKSIQGDCLLMGDFNDWPGNEFVMPAESKYVECWPLVHPKNAGKTMDDTNTFCKLKIEEMFFGRSDKMFLRSKTLKPIEAHLVGTRSVNAENGDTLAPDYLFPSDHYGVSITFSL